jgi:lysophospholipid acyltransferase 5
VLLIIPNRTISLILVFLGALAHLLIGYALISTDCMHSLSLLLFIGVTLPAAYDIDYTTAQSVLCLRMIGFAWDVFDGGRAESVLEHDQKENRIQTLPNLLAVYGYFYFPGGFLIGPQFTYKLYSRFISNVSSCALSAVGVFIRCITTGDL